MEIRYQIVAFDKTTGSISVQYCSPDVDGGPVLNIDLPIENGEYPSGQALDDLIRAFTPMHVFDRKLQMTSTTIDTSAIEALVGPPIRPMILSLPDTIANYQNAIDQAAGAARARFITVTPGQEVTYMMKAQQADEFAAANFQGTVPPYIEAEALATGQTPQAVTTTIQVLRDYWNDLINPKIESTRIGGKQQLGAVTSAEQAQEVYFQILGELSSIGQ